MLRDTLGASKLLKFPGIPIVSHTNLRIRKPMLYPLSYGSFANMFQCGSNLSIGPRKAVGQSNGTG